MNASISLDVMGLIDCLSDPDLILVPCLCLENHSLDIDSPVLLSIHFCSRI